MGMGMDIIWVWGFVHVHCIDGAFILFLEVHFSAERTNSGQSTERLTEAGV